MKETKTTFLSTGRRKTSVARVYLKKGSGKHLINGKPLEEYFPLKMQRDEMFMPMSVCSVKDVDIMVRVNGGGIQAQITAIRLGIARALVQESEERRKPLKDCGFLTRDGRRRERKKYGRRGARKSFQFSKR